MTAPAPERSDQTRRASLDLGGRGASGARGRGRTWQAPVVVLGVVAAGLAYAAPPVVLVLAALVAGIWVVARPADAAVVAVGLLYSNAVVVAVKSHGAPGGLAALVPLLLLVTVSYRVFARREPFLLPRPALWVVALVVAEVLGAMMSRDPAKSVTVWQTLLIEGLVLFALLVNAIRGFAMLRRIALLLVVVGALLGTMSLIQQSTGFGGDWGGFSTTSKAEIGEKGKGAKRHSGPIGEKNRWGQTLAVVLPLAIALGTSDRSRTVRGIALVSGVGIVAGLVLTYSRGALVGLVITGLVAMALRWVRVTVAVAFAAVALVALGAFAPVFLDRASTVTEVGSSVRGNESGEPVGGSISNRTAEANAAISVYLHHPVVGVGAGLFPSYFQEEARNAGAERIVGVDRQAHNLYLGLAAEAGTLGLAAFAGLAISILGPVARTRRVHLTARPDVAGLATGFALAFVTYLSTGLFLHFAYIRYFWLVAALATVMGMVDERPGRAWFGVDADR